MTDLRDRFPGLREGWARFDGPAGTQVVDVAIEAMRDWQRSGNNANAHGAFAAAAACDRLVDDARATIGRFLGCDGANIVFGPSTTSNVMSITRAIARDLGPGDEIVCTKLDHDSNIAPWMLAADDAGATVRLAEFDTSTGRLPTEAVTDVLTARTRWVAVTGASNAWGTMPDITAITEAAHGVGALVAVDGVHLTPHAKVDVAAIGCDMYSTSAYKWYGPHLGATWMSSDVLDGLRPYKVRPAPDSGPDSIALGTAQFEVIAGAAAAAEWIMSEGIETLAARERAVFAPLLDGLLGVDGVTVYGPDDLAARAPTLGFTIDGLRPVEVAAALAGDRIAVWDGHNYAIEAMAAYGLGDEGAVRAGVVAYISDDDVTRLLTAVERLASTCNAA